MSKGVMSVDWFKTSLFQQAFSVLVFLISCSLVRLRLSLYATGYVV